MPSGEGEFDVLGGGRVPLVVHVPHGGVRIPEEVRRGLVVDDERLEAELLLLTDWHTGQLFGPAAVAVGGVAIVNRLSRLVVDHERLPESREPLARVGLGAVYTRTADGTALRARHDTGVRVGLLDRYFAPWAAAVEGLVAAALGGHGRCLILDGHSFPSQPLPYEQPGLARPDVCIGFAEPHTPHDVVAELTAACEAHGFTVAHNEPFAGSYVPLARFGVDTRVTSVMIEVNRARYLDEATGDRTVGFAATAALVAELTEVAARAVS